jgi:phosphatidate cytidylyltransferase
MKRILTAVVLIPLIVVLIFWGPLWLLLLAAGVIAELALHEYLKLAAASGVFPPRWLAMAYTPVLFWVAWWMPAYLLATLGICALIFFVVCAFQSPLERVLQDAAGGLFGIVYVVFPLVLAPLLTTQENGIAQLLFLLVVVWAGDITALYVGRSVGRHPMAPVLSPKKTWEGAIGSMAGSIVFGLLLVSLGNHFYRHGFALLLYTQSWRYWIGMAILLNIAAQLGDLLESAIKRGAHVKDSGDILPGHGGVLDRVDALLLAMPVLWYALLFHQL